MKVPNVWPVWGKPAYTSTGCCSTAATAPQAPNRADAGWYQVRRALEAYGDTELTDWGPFKQAYAALTEKLRPMVYERSRKATRANRRCSALK